MKTMQKVAVQQAMNGAIPMKIVAVNFAKRLDGALRHALAMHVRDMVMGVGTIRNVAMDYYATAMGYVLPTIIIDKLLVLRARRGMTGVMSILIVVVDFAKRLIVV